MQFNDYVTAILVQARGMAELYLDHMASGVMVAVTSVVASSSLCHLTLMIGPNAMALFAHVGLLGNLNTLEIISDINYYDVGLGHSHLRTLPPWELPALTRVSINLESVGIFGPPATLFVEFFCRCTMGSLKDMTFILPFRYNGIVEATLLGSFVSKIPKLTRFHFGSEEQTVADIILSYAACSILELNACPSPQAIHGL
jgi:hypothetical protein